MKTLFLLLILLGGAACQALASSGTVSYLDDKGTLREAIWQSVIGPNGPRNLNAGNFPYMRNALQNHLPPKFWEMTDSALLGQGDTKTAAINSILGLTMTRAGSILGTGTYLYPAGNGGTSPTYTTGLWNDPLWWGGYYAYPTGTGFTNATSLTAGPATSMLVVGYWAANGFGTLTVSTQRFSSSTYGTKGTVATINANNSGALTFILTNFYISTATSPNPILAGLSSSGTNLTLAIVGQVNTNADAGYIYDVTSVGGFDWEYVSTNASNSNVVRQLAQQYTTVLISDQGSPEQGALPAENMWSNNAIASDLGYFTQMALTNDAASTVYYRSNLFWVGLETGRPVLDFTWLFLPVAPTAINPFYQSDGIHLTGAGGKLTAWNELEALGLTPDALLPYAWRLQQVDLTNTTFYASGPGGSYNQVIAGNRISGVASWYSYSGVTTWNPSSASGYVWNNFANSINLMGLTDAGQLTVNSSLKLVAATSAGTVSGNDSVLLNSNKVFYVVTATKTNLVSDAR